MSLNPEADCFDEVQQALGISLPTVLKNVLKINGFSNSKIIQQISEDDIEEMEKFMAVNALDLLQKEEYEAYYGIFQAKPESFKFLQGHRKIIKLMINYFDHKGKQCEDKATSDNASSVCSIRGRAEKPNTKEFGKNLAKFSR